MVETADSDLLDLRKGRPAAGQDPVKRAQIIEGARRVFIDKGFEAAIERGLIEVDDVDLAAYQFTDLCLAGLFRQCIFSYRSKAPSQAEIDHVVRSGVHVFLKAYGTATLAAEEQASESV